MSFDNVCKLLAEKYPADFVSWLTADDARNIKVLKSEDIVQESVIYQDILALHLLVC
jgi:predicted transposase YdaD